MVIMYIGGTTHHCVLLEKRNGRRYWMNGEVHHNIWDESTNEPPGPVYIPLMTVIDFEGFEFLSHGGYIEQEREILQPRLEALGYSNIYWFEGETDSFGPLTRRCRAVDKRGDTVWFVYG
jgi:hypothetical protein